MNRGTDYGVGSQIKFKTTSLMSALCNYSDSYILVKGAATVTGPDNATRTQHVAFKNCAPFTSCITEINNTQVDKARDLDAVMPMYNLLEYSENYLKTTGRLYRFSRDSGEDMFTTATAAAAGLTAATAAPKPATTANNSDRITNANVRIGEAAGARAVTLSDVGFMAKKPQQTDGDNGTVA